ncbi:hypothetical protein ACFE04_021358 [Oxalis oulophora]
MQNHYCTHHNEIHDKNRREQGRESELAALTDETNKRGNGVVGCRVVADVERVGRSSVSDDRGVNGGCAEVLLSLGRDGDGAAGCGGSIKGSGRRGVGCDYVVTQ